MKRRTGLLLYFVAAFAIAWGGILLVMTGTGVRAAPDAVGDERLLAFVAMLLGPSVASLGLTALLDGTRGLRALTSRLGRWRNGRWYFALLAAPALFAAVLGVLSLVSASFAPSIATSPAKGTIILTALVGGLGAGFFEELGWTGFATPRLLEAHGWLGSGLRLGLLWAAWHGLADYWGGAAYGSLWLPHFLEWVVALTAFRVLMTWIYTHTQSLLLAQLLHASFTGSQLLLWPSAATPAQELAWYGLFAALLCLLAAVITRPRSTGAVLD